MTGKQRFLTALRNGTPDRVPIFLRDLTLGLDLCDYTTPEVSGVYDAEKAARCVLASQERFSQDAVVGCIHDLGLDAEALGGVAEFPERGIPFVAQAPLGDDGFAASASVGDLRPGRWPAVLDCYGQAKAEVGERAAVAANVEGPVTRAGILRGLERLAMDLVRHRELAAHIIELSTQMAVLHTRAMLAAGADFVFIAAATDGPAAISPKDYLEFTIPSLKRIVQEARSHGAPVVFHPHGRFTDPRFRELIDAAIDCGIDGYQFGEGCDPRQARELWGERVCLLGGPDVAEVLVAGPGERVREDTRRYLEACMGSGGFVLMASCSLHRGVPPQHIEAMVETVMEAGRYG